MTNVCSRWGRAVFLWICLLVSGCSYTSSNSYNDYLKLALSSDPQTFNPVLVQDAVSNQLISLMFEGLTKIDGESYEPVPALAESIEPDAIGRTWTVRLRPGLKWSDGAALTADDVVFTYRDVIYDPHILSSVRDVMTVDGKAFEVVKIDELTVQFRLPSVFAPFKRVISFPILPKHALASFVDEQRFLFAWGVGVKPADFVCSGPFVLDTYVPGERVILKKNPFYWRSGYPLLAGVVVSILSDSNMTLLKFKRGEIDLIALNGQTFSHLKRHKANCRLFELGPSLEQQFLMFQLAPEAYDEVQRYKWQWFEQKEFRQVVSMAIDRTTMVKHVFDGLGYAQFSPVTQANPLFYVQDLPCYDYNLKRAKEMLRGLGYSLRDGQLYDDQGRAVAFELLIPAESAQAQTVASMIQDDLKQLGIHISIRSAQFHYLVECLLKTRRWEAILLGLTGSIDPHFSQNVWARSGSMHVWDYQASQRNRDWEERIDRLFLEAVQELSPERRYQLYAQWQAIASEELPLIYTVTGAKLVAVSSRLGGVRPSAIGGVLHNVDELVVLPKSEVLT